MLPEEEVCTPAQPERAKAIPTIPPLVSLGKPRTLMRGFWS